ncbi:prolipoprotein diacylglyceryl transferase [candidate division CSSED10-310 bacterium]|uniref:Phosphatidylglycerol--prolipoprotein diacylglyceryl transferase n=1 Tax=candidate division CSSED10-310 bacterium TaxID=2855610 RepID=A0ABV6Z0B5_UNCC1
MRPLLFHIGPIPIRAYGLMIVIGFLCGLWLAIRRGKKENISKDFMMDLAFYLLLAALLGSKILHIIIFWHDYVAQLPELVRHPTELFTYLGSGLIFFGGLIAAVPIGILYIKKHGLPVWKIADIAAPSFPLAHGFGRLGCFLAGCCYGKPCDLPWAVTFNHPDSLAPMNVPLHPTQLYSAIFNFLVVVILLILTPYFKRYGQLFWTYVLLYSSGRFIIEFFRADPRGSLINGLLSTSQFIGLIIIFLAIGAQIWLARTGTVRN